MLVYLDESYDNAHRYFLLGALYVPDPQRLHHDFTRAKAAEGYVLPSGETKEVKYSGINSSRQLRVAQAGVDLFRLSEAWFRCIVVDQSPEGGWSLNHYGRPDEGHPIKRARFYTRCAELLLSRSGPGVNGVLLTDRMTRCAGDDFFRVIGDAFGTDSRFEAGPRFQSVHAVDTALERYQVGQIGDLLTGAILNDLVRPEGSRARYKTRFREYVTSRLGFDSLGPSYWRMPQEEADLKHPKMQVWYWQPLGNP